MSSTTENNQRAHQSVAWGRLGRIIRRKLNSDNDLKVIVQGANSQTGVGKTTFAIELCRWADETADGWNAKEKAFVDAQGYLDSFHEVAAGSALLLDEIGAEADSRRSTSTENVQLSQGWQLLRSRNIVSVATLPSTSMLDKRMLELADVWVLVKRRGFAQPYEINVNDFNGKVSRKPFPAKEHLEFPDLPDWDADKKYLDEIKEDMVQGKGINKITQAEHKRKLKNAVEEAEREKRDKLIRDMYALFDVSYRDISDLDSIDLTRGRVGHIVKGE